MMQYDIPVVGVYVPDVVNTCVFIVLNPAPPVKLTNPLASTVKLAELKAERPIFVASVLAIAWLVCTFTSTTFVAPDVDTGVDPAAVEVPSISKSPPMGTAVPLLVVKLIAVIPAPDIVIVLPEPLVEMPSAPNTLSMPSAGTAVPVSST